MVERWQSDGCFSISGFRFGVWVLGLWALGSKVLGSRFEGFGLESSVQSLEVWVWGRRFRADRDGERERKEREGEIERERDFFDFRNAERTETSHARPKASLVLVGETSPLDPAFREGCA